MRVLNLIGTITEQYYYDFTPTRGEMVKIGKAVKDEPEAPDVS